MYQNLLYVRKDLKITKNNKQEIYDKIYQELYKALGCCDGYYADSFSIGNQASGEHIHFFFKVKPYSECISCFGEFFFNYKKYVVKLVGNTNYCDIANIADLDRKIKHDQIDSVIFDKKDGIIVSQKSSGRTYVGNEMDAKFKSIIDSINNKKIKGIVAFVSIHG